MTLNLDDLIAFTTKQLDTDEAWALASSIPPGEGDEPPPPVEGGVRWHWSYGTGPYDLQVPESPETATTSTVAEFGQLSWLTTIEKFHDEDEDKPLPCGYSEGIHLMELDAAVHIARHDPRRVVSDVKAKRQLIEEATKTLNTPDATSTEKRLATTMLKAAAAPYSHRAGFRKAWSL